MIKIQPRKPMTTIPFGDDPELFVLMKEQLYSAVPCARSTTARRFVEHGRLRADHFVPPLSRTATGRRAAL